MEKVKGPWIVWDVIGRSRKWKRVRGLCSVLHVIGRSRKWKR